MNTATKIENRDLIMPAGLDEKGQQAYQIIVEYLNANKLTTTELKVFYTPAEWRERDEDYGTEARLIVVYDGATSLKRVFSMDACYESARPEGYKHYEALQAKLDEAGLYFQECTRWYGAIYSD
jgi:hypothetical protein